MYETDKEVVVESAIAGVAADELDISLEQDILIIREKERSSRNR